MDDGDYPGVAAGVAGTLVLVQALGDAGIDGKLWVLTSGAVTAGEQAGPVNAAQAMVWGLGRVAALEHPRRWGGLVDAPNAVISARAAGWLRGILAGETGEDQVAIREGGVLARRLVRAAAVDPARARSWRPEGTVLVTGGTGALGPLIARWLTERGASHVVLISRRGIAAAGIAGLAAQLGGAGTRVTVAACDVADRADLAGLLDRLNAAGTPVRGVIHAAAGGKLTPVAALSVPELAEVCRAKVAGAVNLDELLGGSVSTFVMFSSIAGVWGSGRQAYYAAANAFLDALAQDRRARGLVATSVPWGVWLAAKPGSEAEAAGFDPGQLTRQGLPLMLPERGFTGLQQVLDGDEVCTAFAEVDWARFVPVFTSGLPSLLLTGVTEARQAIEADAVVAPSAPGRGLLAGRLAGLTGAEQDSLVLDLVCEQAAAVLGHDSADAVRPGAVFRDLGFDSLTAVELRDKLNVATGLRLPATMVFDYPTPQLLADWLRGQITGIQATGPVTAGPVVVTGDPVAVVAMGCRLPGGVARPDELWELVRTGTDAVSGFPGDRGWETWEGEFVRAGGFVYGAAEFDAGVLRHQPARGAGDGPAAAHAARGLRGGAGAGRDRPRLAARFAHRRVRGDQRPGLRRAGRDGRRWHRRICGDRERGERDVGPGVVRART